MVPCRHLAEFEDEFADLRLTNSAAGQSWGRGADFYGIPSFKHQLENDHCITPRGI